MQWEAMTSTELGDAARKTDVCVVSIASMEKHGEHLPLGSDYLFGHTCACLAAEKEPAVVFPPFWLGQVNPARAYPGAIGLPPLLLLELIQSLFDEIGRNGFGKIIVFPSHGGNGAMQNFLVEASLWEEKPYCLYLMRGWITPDRREAWNRTLDTSEFGHACEAETSHVLAVHPDLVKMDRIPSRPAFALKRLRHLPQSNVGVSFVADYPDFWIGEPKAATAEKGEAMMQLIADSLAEFIAAVKADQVVPDLTREFYEKVKHPLAARQQEETAQPVRRWSS
ncbi:MAG: creatininase family protein [Kiritimatiellae bacterium]|nr:creatininase family protein [Kiritimatiellia bacterium]